MPVLPLPSDYVLKKDENKEWPDVDYWIERLKHEEKSRRKK